MIVQERAATVAHLSSVHPWDDNRIFARHCQSLARSGWVVTLLASRTDTAPPAGDVRVVVRARPPRRLSRLVLHVPRLLVTALRLRADVYHLHDPELAPFIPLLRARGARVVYDAHEDLPSQVLDKTYIPERLRRLTAMFSRVLCAVIDRTADHVVAATPTIASRFDPGHCSVVHNYPILQPEVDDAVPYEGRGNHILYLGGMSLLRGVRQMVDAIGLAHLPADWDLQLVGSFSSSSVHQEVRASPGWSRVADIGQVSKEAARRYIGDARCGLVLFQASRAHLEALPTKMFEYMAAGVPVIASDFPLWREIVLGIGCGLVVDPSDVGAVAKAIEHIAREPEEAQRMGERGRAAVLKRFNWLIEQEVLLKVYGSL